MIKFPRWFWVLTLLVCWPTLLFAQERLPNFSSSGPDGKVTLTAEPCTVHPWLAGWQVAHWMWKGKAYDACWRLQGNGQGGKVVVVLDASGDVASFEPSQFVKDEGM